MEQSNVLAVQKRRVLAVCVAATLIAARVSAQLANKATPKTLNRATGIVLIILGAVMLYVKFTGN